ncbi:glycosyltransferase [Oscillatoria sp. FACHB-1407]|uniref:glycosyltransferase n=1 Tax=Oscillatoria sp. FACHB-1407 TaxID=2692847 RepID=UPI001684794F|nr:glycosyltransferase [Oscillatoria sp. FACHB-1407]MBD2464448.1 glycosyltransferase [Oscillatoria sp. FACHB-1407]
MPLISVVLPVYNGEKTIQRTIESVLKQTFSDFELLIINDGSSDRTVEIVTQINDPRIRLFSYPNSGVSASRNRGIAQATGEFISFIDADDLWTPDKLAAQLNALQTHPDAAVAYSWTDWIDESDRPLRPAGRSTASGKVYEKLLLRDFIESGSNVLIRRQALEIVGTFDETLPPTEDWDLWLRLAAQYEFVVVPSPQILYRVSTQSASCNVWKMEAVSLKVIERAFNQAPTSVQPLKPQVLASRYQYLTLKALEGALERRYGLVATRFFWTAIRHDPSWLRRSKLMATIWAKIAIALLISPKRAWRSLKQV